MGTGAYGGFGHTLGSTKLFTRVWYEGTVRVAGQERDVSRRVYQRNDIDFEYYDEDLKKTSLQLMLAGKAPIGSDGKPIELHHVLQEEVGPLVEIREITHREYRHILHGLRGPGMSFRNDSVLNKQYNNFKRRYWKWRAQTYLEGRDS